MLFSIQRCMIFKQTFFGKILNRNRGFDDVVFAVCEMLNCILFLFL